MNLRYSGWSFGSLMTLWKYLKMEIQFLTCRWSRCSLKQGKRSSKFSSLSFRAWLNLSMRFSHWTG
ncbi:MAG: hypothetical protein JRM79_03390 [Nitrososphaerota archaeon]|nr:hypothetical protein [Nitrososphaerota archaeon]MDG6912763.1 hypothetical protein [Nitrososphaerota archaeon]MDG6958678.1 hypothetical protein [Nitrososphaerota archaeon]MDG6971259.1 hypothetical protein [Nitrososphaerota archaeon]MDG6972691.1 hypothetical protein [Nitrososphaerota archaeon]